MNAVLLLLLLYCVLAIEDITDPQMMDVMVARKFLVQDNATPLLHQEFIGPNPREKALKASSDLRQAPTKTTKLTTKTTVSIPVDNFDQFYQKLNQSMFYETSYERSDTKNPYPKLPRIAFDDDEPSYSETYVTSFARPNKTFNEYLPRTTTSEPYHLKPRPISGAVRQSQVRHTQFNGDSREADLGSRSLSNSNSAQQFLDYDEEVPPPPPPPDWAVQMVLAPEEPLSENEVTEEPFEVTDALENALSTTAAQLIPEKAESELSEFTEVPTMKMYPWEMQRGDIDVGSLSAGQTSEVPNPTFMPVSVRTPKNNNSIGNSVLIPQEVPSETELPKVYTILPRLILPQRPNAEHAGPIPPSAPPTLMTPPRPHPDYTKTTKSQRPFSVKGTTISKLNHDLQTLEEYPQSDLFPFTRILETRPPAIGLTSDPFLSTLFTYPPTPPPHRPSSPMPPAFQSPDLPPGIAFISTPPGFGPEHVTATFTPPPLTTTTPYYTKKLIPKGTKGKAEIITYSPRAIERIEKTTPVMRNTYNFENTKATIQMQYRDRIAQKYLKSTTPATQLNEYFASVQDKSQMNLSNQVHSQLSVMRPPLNNNTHKHYDSTTNTTPEPFFHQSHSQFTVNNHHLSSSININSPTLKNAAVFRIPAPVRLSMAHAVRIKPLMVGMPKNYINHLNKISRHKITQPPLPVLTTTPPRVSQNDEFVSYNKVYKLSDQLNWVPEGLTAPKRLGAVKLLPVKLKTERIELNAFKDEEQKKEFCQIDESDDFADLRAESREFVKKCFRRVKNCLLMDAVPMERRINYNEDQCINFCGHHPYCQSVAYSSVMSICDIFEKRNGSGPIRTVNYLGTTYYEAKNSVATDCWRMGLSNNFFTKAPQTSVLVDSNDEGGVSAEDEEPSRRQESHLMTSKAPVVIAPKDHCDVNQDVAVLKSSGFRIRNFGVIPLHQNSSETECVFSCLVNLARGHIPYECTSTSYSNKGGCLIYKSGSNVKSNGHLVSENGFTHYEKACISKDIVELCKGYPILRQPQHVLLGYTKSTAKAESLIECLEICFDDYSKGGGCKSVMYFYEERDDNCVLNSESQLSESGYFIEENDSLVDYASFENCLETNNDLRHSALRNKNYRPNSFSTSHRRVQAAGRPLMEIGGQEIKDHRGVTVRLSTTATLAPPTMTRLRKEFSVGSTNQFRSTRHRIYMAPRMRSYLNSHNSAPRARMDSNRWPDSLDPPDFKL